MAGSDDAFGHAFRHVLTDFAVAAILAASIPIFDVSALLLASGSATRPARDADENGYYYECKKELGSGGRRKLDDHRLHCRVPTALISGRNNLYGSNDSIASFGWMGLGAIRCDPGVWPNQRHPWLKR